MFTVNPLPVIDTINLHIGFWILFSMLAMINLAAFAMAWDEQCSTKGFLKCFAVSVLILGFIGYNSWTTGEITVPKNEKVNADFVGFIAEGEAYTEKSGKQTVTRENHFLYVAYNVPGYGRVIFPANKNTTYPERVILYKN